MKISEVKAILEQQPTAEQLAQLQQDTRAGVQKLLQGYYKRLDKLCQEKERFYKLQEFERKFYGEGARYICGIDEAGRGPLAGPLVIAGVIMPQDFFISGLNDSKQLSAAKRDAIYDQILQTAVAVCVNVVSVSNIDSLNIYRATQQGMEEIISHLQVHPDVALIDAMPVHSAGVKIASIIHGDALSVSIAAASIVAKVTRDRIMELLDKQYPEYGFAGHKGYGSASHMQAIREHGATMWHRRSYEPVKSMNITAAPSMPNELYNPLETAFRDIPTIYLKNK